MAVIRLTPAFEHLRYLITNQPGYLLKPPRPIPSNVRGNLKTPDIDIYLNETR